MSTQQPDAAAALVTGGAVRVGRAIAVALGRRGWTVVVHYHSSGEDADSVAAEIAQVGGAALTARADLTKPVEISRMFEEVRSRLGRLDLLVNSAAAFPRFSASRCSSPEDHDGLPMINPTTPLWLSRYGGVVAAHP